MKSLLIVILIAAILAFGLHMILPFPFGFIFSIGIPVIIIWYALKKQYNGPFFLLNYKRTDPKTDVELNKEAYRILKKKFLEGEITKEEFEKMKKGFDIEDD